MLFKLFFLCVFVSQCVVGCDEGPAGPGGPGRFDVSRPCAECKKLHDVLTQSTYKLSPYLRLLFDYLYREDAAWADLVTRQLDLQKAFCKEPVTKENAFWSYNRFLQQTVVVEASFIAIWLRMFGPQYASIADAEDKIDAAKREVVDTLRHRCLFKQICAYSKNGIKLVFRPLVVGLGNLFVQVHIHSVNGKLHFKHGPGCMGIIFVLPDGQLGVPHPTLSEGPHSFVPRCTMTDGPMAGAGAPGAPVFLAVISAEGVPLDSMARLSMYCPDGDAPLLDDAERIEIAVDPAAKTKFAQAGHVKRLKKIGVSFEEMLFKGHAYGVLLTQLLEVLNGAEGAGFLFPTFYLEDGALLTSASVIVPVFKEGRLIAFCALKKRTSLPGYVVATVLTVDMVLNKPFIRSEDFLRRMKDLKTRFLRDA